MPPVRGLARALLGVGLLLAGLLPLLAQGAVAVTPLSNFDFGHWSPGTGQLTASRDFCAVSVVGNRLTANNDNQLREFGAKVESLDGSASGSSFRLAHVDGGHFLNLELRLRDLRSGVEEVLSPNVGTATDKTGDELGCPRGGPNGRLIVRLLGSELAGARAGVYTGQFSLEINGGSNGRDTDSTTFVIRVEIPDLVRISSLNDIALGFFPGSGDLSGSDALCVYRNDPAGAYLVEASGQGAGQAFVVAKDGVELPFAVDYSDGSGWRSLTAGGAPVAAGNAHAAATDCGGATNASVRVRIDETVLATAQPGSYAGRLTLTVAPI
ncbi:MAG: hypothetical protein JJT88_19930 [Gammaproteobacteria bacterium]|nr:hypothetical protein [Gammaproteobacteria bacterium]